MKQPVSSSDAQSASSSSTGRRTASTTAAGTGIDKVGNDLSFLGDTTDPEPYFDEEVYLKPSNMSTLYTWDPVSVGYVRKLLIDDGVLVRKFFMTTASLDPPIFGKLGRVLTIAQ